MAEELGVIVRRFRLRGVRRVVRRVVKLLLVRWMRFGAAVTLGVSVFVAARALLAFAARLTRRDASRHFLHAKFEASAHGAKVEEALHHRNVHNFARVVAKEAHALTHAQTRVDARDFLRRIGRSARVHFAALDEDRLAGGRCRLLQRL